MPRVGRIAPGGLIYHVINRGNGRMKLFRTPADYDAFVGLLAEIQAKAPGVAILAFCLMPNHWHLVLQPENDGDLSRFMLRLTTAHVRRLHTHHGRGQVGVSTGHIYQGRYKSFPIQADDHLLAVLRYVEGNAVRAKLTKKARSWKWCSLALRKTQPDLAEKMLAKWPVDVPADWEEMVDTLPKETDLDSIRNSVVRGKPFGSAEWTRTTANQLGLGFTLRPRGRPRKAGK